MTAPPESRRRRRSRWPVLALRALLLVAPLAALAIVAAGTFDFVAARAESESGEYEEPSAGFSAMAAIVLIVFVPLLLAASLPLLFALNGRRPGLARGGLALLAVLAALTITIYVADGRENLECLEVSLASLILPLWFAATVGLALQPACLVAMGLAPGGPLAWARLAWTALVAATIAADLVCVASCRRPGGELLDQVRVGMTRRELIALVSPACVHSGRGTSGLEIVCRPQGPAICRCAPTLTRELVVELDDQARVRSLRSGYRVVGLDRAR